MPVKDAVLSEASRLLTAFEADDVFAFLIDDLGFEIHIGVGDEARAAAHSIAKAALGGWHHRSTRTQTIFVPDWAGSGGARLRISFWQKNDLGERELVGLRGQHRLLARYSLGRSKVGGYDVPVSPHYVEDRWRHRPRFPIDAVITWVDQSDTKWLARKNDALRALPQGRAQPEPARFRNRDELRFLLRSLHAFAPFFRKVFIVTDCRTPDWLRRDHPDLTIVDQTSLLGGEPVFNSLAVETALHHIPDLSEHYVYFNDDMFLARPVEPEAFFSAAGDMRMTEGPLIRPGEPTDEDNAFETSAQQARDLVRTELGWVPTRSASHVPLPQQKSVAREMEVRFGTAIDRTRRSTFRSASNTTSATGLIHYLGAELGAVARSDLSYAYVNTSGKFAPSQYAQLLRSPEVDAFCCNDDAELSALSLHAAEHALQDFLFAYFPISSPYEVTATATS